MPPSIQGILHRLQSFIPGFEPDPPPVPLACSAAMSEDHEILREELIYSCAVEMRDLYFEYGDEHSLANSRKLLFNLAGSAHSSEIRSGAMDLLVYSVGDFGAIAPLRILTATSPHADVRERADSHLEEINIRVNELMDNSSIFNCCSSSNYSTGLLEYLGN